MDILFLKDYKSFKNNTLHSTGIEPVSTPWKGAILPLNYECDQRGFSPLTP